MNVPEKIFKMRDFSPLSGQEYPVHLTFPPINFLCLLPRYADIGEQMIAEFADTLAIAPLQPMTQSDPDIGQRGLD
jgi:hypothetical protein